MRETLEASFGIVPVRRQPSPPLFLLVRHHAGHWGFPKGHAHADETALAAAGREFEEETGICAYEVLPVPPLQETYVLQRHGRNITKTVTYFVAAVRGTATRAQASEIQDLRWVTAEAAAELISYPESRRLLREAVTALMTLPIF